MDIWLVQNFFLSGVSDKTVRHVFHEEEDGLSLQRRLRLPDVGNPGRQQLQVRVVCSVIFFRPARNLKKMLWRRAKLFCFDFSCDTDYCPRKLYYFFLV